MHAHARTNPFPGLRPFMKEEADIFFGRDAQSDELVRRLATRRFVAVVGASGSGKTSLVRAGLLSALEGGLMAGAGAHWCIAMLRPQDDPIGFLAQSIVAAGVLSQADLERTAAESVVETTLRRSSLGLVEVARLARLEPRENLLIIVDQFEEIFRFADLASERDVGDEAPAFVKLLLEAVSQTEVPVYVVITMRSDFLGDCARFRHLPEAISDSQYLIPRLTRDELQAAIAGPIGVSGGRIAPALVQHLLNEIGDDMDQLPVLQHALMRAWDHWDRHGREGRPIELADLEAIGGMARALSLHAEEAFASLATDRDRNVAGRLFKCLTERGPDNREIRRPTPLARLAKIAGVDTGQLVNVIDEFRTPSRSFLMPPGDVALEGDSVIDISHESLIRQWSRLRTWVEEESESRATYLRLVEAARLRHAGKGGLWGEPDLGYAKQWRQREAPNKTWAELYAPGFEDVEGFLRDSEAACTAAAEQERQRTEAERVAKERELKQAQALAEAERRRAEEQATGAARLRKLLRLASIAAAFAVVFAVTAGFLLRASIRARDEAVAQSVRADAQRLSSASTAIAPQYPQRALLLAAEAMASGADLQKVGLSIPYAEQALRDTLSNSSGFTLQGIPGQYSVVEVSPDSRWLAVGTDTGSCYLIDLRARRPLTSSILIGHEGRILSLAFSPDGQWLVTGSDDTTARLWNLTKPKPSADAVVLRGHKDAVSTVAISADQHWLATGSADGSIHLWNLTTADPSRNSVELQGHDSAITAIVFTHDKHWLATASGNVFLLRSGEVRLWDVTAPDPGAHSVILLNQSRAVISLRTSPGHRWLMAGGGQFGGHVWDLNIRDPAKTRFSTGTDSEISPDDRWLFSIDASGHDAIMDLAALDMSRSGAGLRKGERKPRIGGARRLAFSPDNHLLVTAADDGKATLWSMGRDGPNTPRVFRVRRHAREMIVSMDSRWLVATAGNDNAALLWDLTKSDPSQEPMELRGSDSALGQLLLSTDGRWLIAVGESLDVVHVWDLPRAIERGDEVVLREAISAVSDTLIAFSSDSHRIAISLDGGIRLRDVNTETAARTPQFLQHNKQEIWSMAFSPDGRRVVAGTVEGAAWVWDVTFGATQVPVVLLGHTDLVGAVAISANNRWLATGSNDKTARLWDLSNPDPAAISRVLPAHSELVHLLAFSPDTRWLATVELRGVWDCGTLPCRIHRSLPKRRSR